MRAPGKTPKNTSGRRKSGRRYRGNGSSKATTQKRRSNRVNKPRVPSQRAAGRSAPAKKRHAADSPPQNLEAYQGSNKLKDKVALIAAGDIGIGRAVAILFAREGANVTITFLDAGDNARTVGEAVADEGTTCYMLRGDVRDPMFCKDAVAKTIGVFGRLDVLVNGADFRAPCDELEDVADEQLQETLQTEVAGCIHMTRAALPFLGSGAAIINSGSEADASTADGMLDHAASMGAVHAFTQALAQNVRVRGIRVNAVAQAAARVPPNRARRNAKSAVDHAANSSMGRSARAEELAPAYVFFAAPACSSWITGSVLEILGAPGTQ